MTEAAPKPCVICVAIAGQVESTHAAFEAGASIAHCHVRNDDESPTWSCHVNAVRVAQGALRR